jgi:hypothetical protein
MSNYSLPKGRPSEKPAELRLKYTQVFERDGIKTTWIWDKTIFANGPISVEVEYPKNFKSYEEEQATLSATKRMYFDEVEGYYVSYQTAKKKGII